MRSLRFRLPAIFLLGVVLAGLVTAVIAIRLFEEYTEEQTVKVLRRQAAGLAATPVWGPLVPTPAPGAEVEETENSNLSLAENPLLNPKSKIENPKSLYRFSR